MYLGPSTMCPHYVQCHKNLGTGNIIAVNLSVTFPLVKTEKEKSLYVKKAISDTLENGTFYTLRYLYTCNIFNI